MRERPQWIRAGAALIEAAQILWIDTAARWTEPDGDGPRDAWGEVRPGHAVERTGVEVHFWMRSERESPLRFADGGAEADDLRRFVQSFPRPE